MKRGLKIIIFIFGLFLILFLLRLISPREIDDISPEISCAELKEYNSEILWVIPLYNNKSISENREWCEEILSLNKKIGMHGVYHNYREFLYENMTQEELNLAISEFEKCFGYKPEMFKPPQLKISKQNKELIQRNNLELESTFNQINHKVYHCNNTGRISNWIVKII